MAAGDSGRPGIQRRLDAILDRVEDRVSGVSLARAGLVERFRFQPGRGRLLVLCRPRRAHRACCLLLEGAVVDHALEELRSELERAFPELRVEFVFPEA